MQTLSHMIITRIGGIEVDWTDITTPGAQKPTFSFSNKHYNMIIVHACVENSYYLAMSTLDMDLEKLPSQPILLLLVLVCQPDPTGIRDSSLLGNAIVHGMGIGEISMAWLQATPTCSYGFT